MNYMKIGLDTNILYYSISSDEKAKHKKSTQIIEELIEKPYNFMISYQAIAELNHAIRKNENLKDLAIELTNNILDTFKTIPHYSKTEINLSLGKKPFFDSLMAHTYYNNGCNKIFTENIKDMPKIENLEYINPYLD